MKCPDCGAEMKPLAYSEFCPNDCDRKVQVEIDPEKTEKIIFSTDSTVSLKIDDEDLERWWDNLNWDTD